MMQEKENLDKGNSDKHHNTLGQHQLAAQTSSKSKLEKEKAKTSVGKIIERRATMHTGHDPSRRQTRFTIHASTQNPQQRDISTFRNGTDQTGVEA
eukprot:SAG11_NODE_769_length_7262_cov_20.934385_6_plen_96_part_00